MVADVSSDLLRQYPTELIRFAGDEAGRDAEDVAAVLAAAGLAPPPGETRGLPPGILLDLGAVVRLRRWEAAGLAVHIEAGLPSAHAALNHVVATLTRAAANPAALATAGALGRAVFDTAVTRLAWAGPPELGADIALGVADEDILIDALARLLWARRKSAPADNRGRTS